MRVRPLKYLFFPSTRRYEIMSCSAYVQFKKVEQIKLSSKIKLTLAVKMVNHACTKTVF